MPALRNIAPRVAPMKMPSSIHAGAPSTGTTAAVGQIGDGRVARGRVSDQPRHHRRAEDEGEQREGGARNHRRLGGEQAGTTEICQRLAAEGATGFGLRHEGESIEHEGPDGDDLLEDLVSGKRRRPLAGAGIDEPGEAEDQRPGADHQVDVDVEQAAHGGKIEQRRWSQRPLDPSATRPHGTCDKHQTDDEAQPVGNRRRLADTSRSEVQAKHEPQVERDIDETENDRDCQRRAGSPDADEPARKRVDCQSRWSTEGARCQVGGPLDVDGGLALHDGQAGRGDGTAQRDHGNAQHRGNHQGAHQDALALPFLAGAGRLRHQSGRAHPQEVEAPQEDADDRPSERNAAEVRRVAGEAKDEGISRRCQRHRGIGEDQWPGATQHLKARQGFGCHRPALTCSGGASKPAVSA